MEGKQYPALALFVVGLVGLGILALVHGDFALVWQPVPAWLPGRVAVAYATGVLMIAVGLGLLLTPTRTVAVSGCSSPFCRERLHGPRPRRLRSTPYWSGDPGS